MGVKHGVDETEWASFLRAAKAELKGSY